LALNNDLLPFLARETKFSAELTPRSHVYESSDQLTFAFTVVEEIIVGDSDGSDWSPGNLGLPRIKRKERIALGLDGEKVLSPEYYGSSKEEEASSSCSRRVADSVRRLRASASLVGCEKQFSTKEPQEAPLPKNHRKLQENHNVLNEYSR
jgi:hypothetical protein